MQNFLKTPNSKGLTLLEILVVMTVGSIAGVLLLQIFVQNSSLLTQQSAKVSHGLGLNESISQLEKSIRVASAVATGYPEASPTYTTSSTILVTKVPSTNGSGGIIDSTFDFFVFTQDSNNPKVFRKLVFPNPQSARGQQDSVLTTNLQSISFQYLNSQGQPVTPTAASKVSFSLTASTDIGVSNQIDSASSEVNLRND